MSRGSHIVRRGRAALSTSGGLFSTPREPLLFLYPQWIRTATTAVHDLGADSRRDVPSIGHDHISNFYSVYGNVALGIPGCEKTSRKDRGSPPRAQEALSKAIDPAENGHELTNGQAQQALENDRMTATLQYSKSNMVPLDPKPIARRIVASETKRAMRRAYKKQIREDYEERKMSARLHGVPNWRGIYHGLETRTPNGSENGHDKVLTVKIRPEAVGRLLLSEEDNIWEIKVRCGCQIELSKADEANSDHRIILLSGTASSISKAAAEIFRVAAGSITDTEIPIWQLSAFSTKTKKRQLSVSDGGSSPVLARYVRANPRQRMATPIRADKIPRPSVWTPESFGLYIQHLTSIRMSAHTQRMLYPFVKHTDVVVKILHETFSDPECRTAISAPAFNDALAYLVGHNAIHVVRDLFVLMELRNFKMNTETFNIMLRGAAKARSTGNFHHIFWLMLRRGYTPNADTWLAFMRVMEDPQIKELLLIGMKNKDLLNDPQTQKRVCENFVEIEIKSSLGIGMTLEQFVAHMTGRYGRDWLSTDSASRILDAFGSRGLISDCWAFLKFMHTEGVELNGTSVLIVLHHCERQDNPHGAIEIIRRVSSFIGFEASQAVYHSLFNIAWKARLHCVARVVWHYACLNAGTTFLMRSRIIRGVLSAIPNSTHSPEHKFRPRKEWTAIVGRFIIGIPIIPPQPQRSLDPTELSDTQPPGYPTAIPSATDSFEEGTSPMGEYFNPAKDGPNRDKEVLRRGDENAQKETTMEMMDEQLQAFHSWVPQRHFADVLVEALKMDQEWMSSGGHHEDKWLESLNLRAPAMPVRRRTPQDKKLLLGTLHPLRRRVSMWKLSSPERYPKCLHGKML